MFIYQLENIYCNTAIDKHFKHISILKTETKHLHKHRQTKKNTSIPSLIAMEIIRISHRNIKIPLSA